MLEVENARKRILNKNRQNKVRMASGMSVNGLWMDGDEGRKWF